MTGWTSRDLRPPTVDEVVEIARAYYALPGNGAGGSFHIVLDDGNVRGSHVAWCEGYASGSGDKAGRLLGSALRRLTRKQRKALCRRYAEYAP